MNRARVTTRELELSQDGAIRLPFGSALRTVDTLERCLPA